MKKQLRAALALNLKSLLFVSLLMGAVSGVRADDYELYTGELTAGDYLVVYNSKAMKAAISNSRLSYTEVTITNNVITNPAANLVWTIAADGKYFTLYNSSVAKYAASTGAANKARLDASTSDNARWTVTGNTTYEFVNYANDKGGVNKNLRNNGTYGFACYSTSTGGALSLYKLKKVTISKNPTITGDANTFFTSKTVTITAADGAAIYYTLDGNDPTTSSTKYTQPFEITNTTTVKAIAVEEGKEASAVVEETFEKVPVYTLGELAAKAAGSYYVNFQNAVVTYVNGSYCYMQDATGAILYMSASNGRKAGDILNGTAQVTFTLYNSLPEITEIKDATFTEGAAPTPVVVTLAELTANYTAYLSKYIKVEGATVTSALNNKAATIEQNGVSIALRQNGSKTIENLSQGAIINLTTFPSIFNTTQQLAVYSDDLIEVLYEKADAELAFPAPSYNVSLGEAFTAPTLTNPHNLDVTYSSSTPDVASVDAATGAVTIKAAGDAVITATFSGNNDYKPAAVSYTIIIEDTSVENTYYALVAECNGSYFAVRNSVSSSAFNATEVDVFKGKVITPMSDNIAWKIETSGSNAYLINKAKGSDGYNQYIGFTAGGTTLSRKNSRSDDDKWTIDATHKSWLNSENQRSIIYNSTSNNFKNYVVGKIGTGSFATSYTQAYTFASGYTRTVTAGAWGTICLPNDVAADDYAGVKFYSIAGKDKAVDPTSITLQEVSELEAGVPYLFQVNEDATKLLAAYGKQSVATAGSNNGLIGSFAGTDVAEGMYLLSGGKIVLCGTGCSIAANRAYINMDEVPIVSAGVKGVTFFFNGQVGVNGLEADNQQKTAVYDLTGRSVNQTRQGLYIVNGKKVMVK